MIASILLKDYITHSLSTLYYYNAPSLTIRLTGNYRSRTYTDWCDPASLGTLLSHKKAADIGLRLSFASYFVIAAHFTLLRQTELKRILQVLPRHVGSNYCNQR